MLILDTNHYSEFARKSTLGTRLRSRIESADEDAFLTVITAEEVLKGWLAAIKPYKQPDRGVRAYRQFQDCLMDLAGWEILPWSTDSADIFDQLRAFQIEL